MSTATDACMLFACECRPFFFWGRFPTKRYVRSFVVVFLFRVYNLERSDALATTRRMQNASSPRRSPPNRGKVDDDSRERESRRGETHRAQNRIIWRRRLRHRHHHHLLLTVVEIVKVVETKARHRALAMRASTERWENRPQSGCHRRSHHREKTPVGDKNGRKLSPGTRTDWTTGKEEEEVLKARAET